MCFPTFCIFRLFWIFCVYFVYYVEVVQWQIYWSKEFKKYHVIKCIKAKLNVYFVVNIILKKWQCKYHYSTFWKHYLYVYEKDLYETVHKHLPIFSECSEGTYGNGCANKCSGHCVNDASCNKQTGHCDRGCKPGYTNYLCSESKINKSRTT